MKQQTTDHFSLTEKIDAAWNLRDTDPKKAIELSQQAELLARSISDELLIAKCLRNIGAAHFRLSDYNAALSKINEALILFQKSGICEEEISCNNLIGNTFIQLGNYSNALEYLLKNVELLDTVKNKKLEVDTCIHLGICYFRLGDADNALSTDFKGLEIAKEINDIKSIGAFNHNIGNIFGEKRDHASSLTYHEKGLAIFIQLKDKYNESHSLENMGIQYYYLNQIEKSKECFLESLRIREGLNDKTAIAGSCRNVGYFYLDQNDCETALKYLNRSLDLAKEIGNKATQFQAHSYLAMTYKKLGDFKSALFHYEQFHTIEKLVFNEKTFNAAKSLQIYYDLQKVQKEKEIFRLKNIDLAEAKAEIEEKNKDITDSIRYAKRIQEAILPNKELIYKVLPQAFIFYQPKDIVSGDFYWFAQKDGHIIIAAVDCTGHGVPGAFMSMIGNSLLHEIVNEKRITQPDEILNLLHNGIRKALKQDKKNAETRDGMDIALVCLTPTLSKGEGESQRTGTSLPLGVAGGGLLQFAGAMRPLYYIRKGILNEIKGDKLSIGGLHSGKEKKLFTNHILQLQQGDAVYLSSDGYIHQFGGAFGKKFSVKNFQQLLLDVHNLDAQQQELKISEAFAEWKGSDEQIDDVLVIGINV